MLHASRPLIPAAVVFAITWLWVAFTAPDRVPMHWGADGTVDRWGSRTEFLTVMLVTALATSLLIVGFAAFAPRMPESLINTPHREYWLSPEHRRAFDALTRSMLLNIAALTVLLFAAINAFVALDVGAAPAIAVIVCYLVVLAIVIGIPLRRLYREPR
ncbi:hypothetical protein GOARA_046_00030 [Gordonia araii NBRC 100433]|uniref:DUF1648 domain-containing protein n=1 Tax=Gordonia araii NBRC 100433 TaxID=1073574 RepID=G7H1K9_9ACTN|nr:DUF1648 domain-containing protein [Gordonia araii]NNG98261.1 DUF1648 domain-containing protein [Gordonia araii NBRC 100433]GAB09734.1 hypothetical protein GOARA_046_00030 [Gordonia araii NBRC 100433]